MGLILTVLTLAVSLARETVVRHMRRVTPHMKRVAAVLLGVAGIYVMYYGWYSLRVYGGNFDGGGPAKVAYDLSGRMSTWIASVGPIRIGVIALAVITVTLVLSFARQVTTSRDRG